MFTSYQQKTYLQSIQGVLSFILIYDTLNAFNQSIK